MGLAITVRVNYGTAFDDINFPKVSATMDDGSTKSLDANWDEASSVPAYDKNTPRDYSVEGELVLPANVTNPDNVKAEATLTVGDIMDVLEVQSPPLVEVPFGTAYADIPFPDKVFVKAGDDWEKVSVNWAPAAQANPAYNRVAPGNYTFAGTLVMPDHLKNPGGIRASQVVTVSENEDFPVKAYVGSQDDFIKHLNRRTPHIEVANSFTVDIRQIRVVTDGLYLDLDGNTITLAGDQTGGAAIAFEGDDITVENGTFSIPKTRGAHVDGALDFLLTPFRYDFWIMADGTGITFDTVTFNTYFRDWYQVQATPAMGLTMDNCTFNLPALFQGPVLMEDCDINAAVGIQCDNAVLNNPTLNPNPVHPFKVEVNSESGLVEPLIDTSIPRAERQPVAPDSYDDYGYAVFSQGMLYIPGDATINNLTLDGGHTGIYVGKDLKSWLWYYLVGIGREEVVPPWEWTVAQDDPTLAGWWYSKAQPTITDINVISDKYEQTWIAVQYDKAVLTINGEVNIDAELAGLTLLGRGLITGNAVFTGDDVFIGWQTLDYMDWNSRDYTQSVLNRLYPGEGTLIENIGSDEAFPFDDETYPSNQRVKAPPYGVDQQAACKSNCKLTISGSVNIHPTFESDVFIFDSLHENVDYLITDEVGDGWNEGHTLRGMNATDATPAGGGGYFRRGGVMFGNVTLGYAHLWGNFTIVDGKTVIFEEIRLECGKTRVIYGASTGTSFASPPPDCDKDRDDDLDKGEYYSNAIRGTLKGGIITSDTKDTNLLVIGDGVRVQDVIFGERLYDVEVRSATLQDVEFLNVGNTVNVVANSDATFWNVMWAGNGTDNPAANVSVIIASDEPDDQARVTFRGAIDNRGWLTMQEFAHPVFFTGVTFTNDIREGNEVLLYSDGGWAYIEAKFADYHPYWQFEDWKLDIEITIDNPVSTKYKFNKLNPTAYVNAAETTSTTWYVDYRDPDVWSWDFRDGAWLRDVLGINRSFPVGYAHLDEVSYWAEDDDGDYQNYILDNGRPLSYDVVLPLLSEGYSAAGVLQDSLSTATGMPRSMDDIRLRLALPESRTITISISVWGVNCCTQERIPFGSQSRTISFTPKFSCDYFDYVVGQIDDWHRLYPWLEGWSYTEDVVPGVSNPYQGYIVRPGVNPEAPTID